MRRSERYPATFMGETHVNVDKAREIFFDLVNRFSGNMGLIDRGEYTEIVDRTTLFKRYTCILRTPNFRGPYFLRRYISVDELISMSFDMIDDAKMRFNLDLQNLLSEYDNETPDI